MSISGRTVARGTAWASRRSSAPIAGNSAPSATRPLTARSYASTSSPPNQGGLSSGLLMGSIAAVTASIAYVLGSLYPPTAVKLAFSPPAPPSADRDSPEGQAITAKVEADLQNIPLVRKLLSASSPAPARSLEGINPSVAVPDPAALHNTHPGETAAQVEAERLPHWLAMRPYKTYPPSKATHSLTAGSLRGPGKIAVPPLVLVKTEAGALAEGGVAGEALLFVHLGRSLCGHDGVVHGGMLCTLADEALARAAFYGLPNGVAVTARLEVDFKSPVLADQFVCIKTKINEVQGRKAYVEGQIETLDGTVAVKAKALFIEPKYAKYLTNRDQLVKLIEGR